MLKIGLLSEQQLLNRIKSNDRSVLGELFVKYEKMVLSYVKANGGDANDADDLLQEAIIVLWQNVCSGRFELKAKLSTYVLGVVKNKWMAERRRRSKFSDGELPEDTSDGTPSFLDSVIDSEKVALVQQALDELNPPCRELLLLFYFEERTLKDIARIMGFANTDVVKSKKYQCKKSLQTAVRKVLAETERRS
ncbi:MAG: RNA polymerase sigma factor [bacterium]